MTDNQYIFNGYANDIQKKLLAGEGINIDGEQISVSETLQKYGEINGEPTYDGNRIASKNTEVLDRFTGEKDHLQYGTYNIALAVPDSAVPLELGVEYESLSVREDWAKVPVYVTGSPFKIGLYADDTVDCDSVSIVQAHDFDTGLPVLVLRATVDGKSYACYSRAMSGIADYSPGWYDADNTPCDPPALSGLTFGLLYVGNTAYTDPENLPAEARSALDTLSRMVNVSDTAMGGIPVVENAVQLFDGILEPDRIYALTTSRNITLSLPQIDWRQEEAQFVLYLTCTVDVDVTFPQDTRFIGSVPSTKAGIHKLIGTWLRDAGCWAVGGLDVEDA